jgi:hypothetical protein
VKIEEIRSQPNPFAIIHSGKKVIHRFSDFLLLFMILPFIRAQLKIMPINQNPQSKTAEIISAKSQF